MNRLVVNLIQEADELDLTELQAAATLAQTKAEALTNDGATSGNIKLVHGSTEIYVSMGGTSTAPAV